ncbi:hypothetical protein CEP54_011055 [Fusarium duplospermum]|uniref:Heterokaryon incompatibility domain-containing protein n=1 Tax=Fusarium duplospermum TaxID=1325734 RepID=A0A428PGH9_9HYPO|nr:hypothetical protein CEP54_011055 [Fusarium duplospermum]
MDPQPNPHPLREISTSSTDPPLPEISVPAEWFLSPSVTDLGVSITDTVQELCNICSWDGTRRTLFHFNNFASPTLGSLKRSECVSCQLLFVACQSVLEKISDRQPGTFSPNAELGIVIWGSHFITTPNQNVPGQRVIAIVQDTKGAQCPVSVGFYVFIPAGQYRGEPPVGLPTKRILSGPISPVSSASWARHRLESCLGSHDKCVLHRSQNYLPTRLIDVRPLGPEGNVKLTQGLNLPKCTRYAALSYVWGDPKLQEHIKTTRSTLANHSDEIKLSSLPKALRDAVVFTRELGLDFLWVDSLCIIQNDQDEWTHEAGRMYDVYGNSCVTLVALWGRDCDSGLFDTCAEWQSQQIATLRLGQDTWPLHVSEQHEVLQLNHRWYAWKPPLLTRAWCFQERLVPPRCVFFGRSELIFGCHQGVNCECGINYGAVRYPPSSQYSFLPSSYTSETREIQTHLSLGPDHGLRWADPDPRKAWRQVVEDYSFLKLSSEKDRLIALGAVAKQLSYSRPGEQYLAGMWSATLLIDLCWCVPEGNWDYREEPGEKTTMPSWSWASRAKHVKYQGVDLISPTAEVIQVSCKYKNDNTFGILEESDLILQGRVMHWLPGTSGRNWSEEWSSMVFFDSNGTPIHGSCIREDGRRWKEIPPGTYLFELGRWSDDHLLRVFLVLKCRDEENSIFSREAIINPASFLGRETTEDIRELGRNFDEHSKIRECTIV